MDFASSRWKCRMIVSMYDSCKREMVHAPRFQVTLIPKSQWMGPRSVMEWRVLIFRL